MLDKKIWMGVGAVALLGAAVFGLKALEGRPAAAPVKAGQTELPTDPDAPFAAHECVIRLQDERPALVCTLHESQKRYSPEVKPSFGQTLVYGVDPCPPMIERVVARMNGSKLEENEAWRPSTTRSPPRAPR